jgi:hypothetical protein
MIMPCILVTQNFKIISIKILNKNENVTREKSVFTADV